MYSRKIYATGSASGNSLAQITLPSKGRIVGVQWAVWYDSITDNAGLVLEISRSASSEIGVNSAQQCVSELAFRQNFVTSGLAPGLANAFFPVDVPMDQGQILYMHGLVVGVITFTGGAVIWMI
jgi:hypothetical protein